MSTASAIKRNEPMGNSGQRNPQFNINFTRSESRTKDNPQAQARKRKEDEWREMMAKREYFLKNL